MEFNVNPYYDDFDLNAKDNNYLKILFKPGYSVQARELTQIQSILQNQIKQLGDHIFQNGSPVIGGNLTLDNKISYLKLDDTYNNEDIDLDAFVGKIIIRDSDGVVQAKVMTSYYPSGGKPTIMIKYLSGTEFADGDIFKVAGTSIKAKAIATAASGKGTVVSINDGIFYVDGYFVTVVPQTAVVGAYTQNANVKIGLEISDDVVDYVVDSTLLDPAQSSFNYQAPGADRYQYNLNLSTRPLATAVDESKFFELMRVENGAVTKLVKYPIYSELEKTLARRTFDESGDYTVSPFRASVARSSDDNKYVINIEPGKAYVKGFEFETIGTFKLDADKPRTVGLDTRDIVEIDVGTTYGNYLKFKNVLGSASSFVDIGALETVDLHCLPANSVNIGISAAANTFMYQNTKIGTAKVRNIQRDTSGATEFSSDFRVYFSDISIQPRVLRMNTTATGITSNTINLTSYSSSVDNAYLNVSVTMLPLTLTPIANVNVANVFMGSTIVNANSVVANVFYDPLAGFANVGLGTIIRVGDETRQVINIGTNGSGKDYLIVNSAFTKTIIGTNQSTNPLEILRQNTYSSNVTNQTRQIIRYDGASRLAYLDRSFDDNAVPVQNSVIQLNYGIKDLESIMDANVSTPVVNCHANVSSQSKLINGDVEMFQPYDTGLIYRLPAAYVKKDSLTGVKLTHTKMVQRSASPAGTFVVGSGTGLEAFESIPWSITNSNIEDNLIVFVRGGTGTGVNAVGQILSLNTANVSMVGSDLYIKANTLVTDIDVYLNVKENNVQTNYKRTKTYRSNADFTLSPYTYPASTGAFTPNYTVTINGTDVAKINVSNGLIFITNSAFTRVDAGDPISLFVPDVVNVRKILKGTATSEPSSGSYTDITDNFIIDYGQRDEIYDHAKIILKQGYPSPNANLLVHVDFFEHTYPAGASFFSVDSYSDTLYSTGMIPVYTSTRGGTYFLRDCLDFRSTRQIGVATGAVQVANIPSPDASTTVSYRYYLPRIDKLVLSKNKEFRIIEGISSPAPIPPADEEGSMTLYNIYLPPYVSNVSDIRLKYFENKRYTMKDISGIDKRLAAVEYYTALNNIENMALGDVTQYEDGTNKEKYGIIGENFKNYNIADYKNKDFTVNLKENSLMPYMISRPHDLSVVSVSNATENEKTITLSYTETPAISQNVTSNKTLSVQPFLFAQFIGTMKLTPELDYWASEELKPEVIRGPEVTTIIKEITHSVTVQEKVIEKEIIVTVPTPTTNANSVVTTTPGTDTGPPANIVPVIVVDPPPVLPPEPIEPQPPKAPPVPYMPPLYTGPSTAYASSGYASTSYSGWGTYAYDLQRIANAGWVSASQWIPQVKSDPVVAATPVTPLPITSAQVYDTPIVAYTGSDSYIDYSNYYAWM